jgi:hypothetical protein
MGGLPIPSKRVHEPPNREDNPINGHLERSTEPGHDRNRKWGISVRRRLRRETDFKGYSKSPISLLSLLTALGSTSPILSRNLRLATLSKGVSP